jgi:hypothetical protein
MIGRSPFARRLALKSSMLGLAARMQSSPACALPEGAARKRNVGAELLLERTGAP